MTLSEQLFDKYLNSRKIKFEVEKGSLVHPDRFLNLTKGLVICEVKQLEGKINQTFWVGNPYSKLRNAIKSKVRQGKEAKESSTPYVIVLFNYGSPQIMSNEVVQAVMYGDISIVIDLPSDPKQKGKVRGNFFSANGILRHARDHKVAGRPYNKRISAVAILEQINPTDEVLDKEYEKASEGVNDLDQDFKIYYEVAGRLKKEGKYDEKLRVERLRVFHNFYADNPLDVAAFKGKYDEQYYINPATGESMKY